MKQLIVFTFAFISFSNAFAQARGNAILSEVGNRQKITVYGQVADMLWTKMNAVPNRGTTKTGEHITCRITSTNIKRCNLTITNPSSAVLARRARFQEGNTSAMGIASSQIYTLATNMASLDITGEMAYMMFLELNSTDLDDSMGLGQKFGHQYSCGKIRASRRISATNARCSFTITDLANGYVGSPGRG